VTTLVAVNGNEAVVGSGGSVGGWLVGSLFYDAFSVARLCSVDDRVIIEW
jgi:hypothetical protein